MQPEDSRFSERTLREYATNPVGLTVQLHDGQRFIVAGFIDSPRGRWLRLRWPSGRFGSFVRDTEVASIIYTEAWCTPLPS